VSRNPLPFWAILFIACVSAVGCPTSPDDDDSGAAPSPAEPTTAEVSVRVTLDGAPATDTALAQGGAEGRWTTGDDGVALVVVDLTVQGDLMVVASHPAARQAGTEVDRDDPSLPLEIALSSFETTDNPEYLFKDPGEPDRRESTTQCAHCHLTINADWVESKHADAARDLQVQDLYRGAASAHLSEESCAEAGGDWLIAPIPGGGEGEHCFVGDGVLPALNDCASGDCSDATAFGLCADCHAPGIDGVLGGRDLREATGHAYDYGVHCDVCHRVESVDLTSTSPGVAGALRLLRPSGPGAFTWPERPLTFGPYDDVPLGVMGAVQRDHFGDERLCAGCHQLEQPVLVPGAAIDATRWPSGRLPIHTTYGEWLAGPMNPGVPCPACHMPPDPSVGNAADIQLGSTEPGMVTGWWRAPGAVRRHTFDGPEDGAGPMLALAASLDLETTVTDGELVASATVRNVGAGHAIPTGEPLRSLLLLISAQCGDAELTPVSGPAVPDLGGALQSKETGEDWTIWPGAEPGQVVRVISAPGTWRDDPGFGPFGNGTFTGAAKGLPVETPVGSATIVQMDGDQATFDRPLPAGDRAWLGEPADPAPGSPAELVAGAPGWTFARVLSGADGQRHVPHFLAVDVVSDNRLMPAQAWTGEWTFTSPCAEPATRATLLYRQWPVPLGRERGWAPTDVVVVEATR